MTTTVSKEPQSFTTDNFYARCDQLAALDPHLRQIINEYGYPPMWSRPNNFASLIHIILEQQVSLASANAAFTRLKQRVGTITAAKLLKLNDEELRDCYFSRQKTVYARHLAEMILSKKIVLKSFRDMHDDQVREQLLLVKGIGHWTVDIYLLFTLQRTNIFPVGDLAMIKALRELKGLGNESGKEAFLKIAQHWEPNRSIATILLWHYYLRKRNIQI